MFTFGRFVPQDIVDVKGKPVRWWGARAIFNECRTHICLVWDRQSVETQEGRDIQVLLDWLNKTGFKELVKQPGYKQLTSDSNAVVEFKERQFTIQCSPQGSHGYLYLGAWQYYPDGCTYEMKELPANIVTPKPGQAEWPEGVRWSNPNVPPPAIGSIVTANINGTWRGKVTGYFIECQYLGIEVECDLQPQWVVDQNRPDKRGLFFGCDLREVKAA